MKNCESKIRLKQEEEDLHIASPLKIFLIISIVFIEVSHGSGRGV